MLIDPSLSAALALTVMVAGALKLAPVNGEVKFTVGALFSAEPVAEEPSTKGESTEPGITVMF